MTYTWHPSRDGFGDVLGPAETLRGERVFPWVAQGLTFDQAVERFGDVERSDYEIPATIDTR